MGSDTQERDRRRRELTSVEFDWLLVDRDGAVALCCSFIDGEIPDVLLDLDEPQLERYGDALVALPRQLPVISEVREENGGMGSDFAVFELARRGIYVFDWEEWDGPYRRVLVPTQPVQFAVLEPALGAFRSHVPRADVSFADTESFRPPDLLPAR